MTQEPKTTSEPVDTLILTILNYHRGADQRISRPAFSLAIEAHSVTSRPAT